MSGDHCKHGDFRNDFGKNIYLSDWNLFCQELIEFPDSFYAVENENPSAEEKIIMSSDSAPSSVEGFPIFRHPLFLRLHRVREQQHFRPAPLLGSPPNLHSGLKDVHIPEYCQ